MDARTTDDGQTIYGVGPDTPTETNAQGGKQSSVPYAFYCFDAQAMFAMARVLKEGADKYGKDNWRNIGEQDHINHLLMHIFAYQAGDRSDDHISHIMCRAMFLAGVHYADAKPAEIQAFGGKWFHLDPVNMTFTTVDAGDDPRAS